MHWTSLLFLIVLAGIGFWLLNSSKEGYYSDYQTMSQLPFITPPFAPQMLGGWEMNTLRKMYPDALLPRFSKYDPSPSMNVFETGTAYDPNIYSEFGVVDPDDIWMF